MRDEMIPQVMLSRLRSRDVVHILLVSSDPEDSVTVLPVSGQRIGLAKEIAGIVDHIQHIEQPPQYKGWTNIGGVLAYAKRIAQVSQGAKSQAPQVVVLALTDGILEGPQTKSAGAWPANVQVWFWGVARDQGEPLQKWATKEMALPPEQLTVVRFSDWKTMADVFGHKIGRPFQNLDVLKGAVGQVADRRR